MACTMFEPGEVRSVLFRLITTTARRASIHQQSVADVTNAQLADTAWLQNANPQAAFA